MLSRGTKTAVVFILVVWNLDFSWSACFASGPVDHDPSRLERGSYRSLFSTIRSSAERLTHCS